MKTAIITVAVLALTSSIAYSQGRSAEADAPRPTIGMGSKTMESCTMDKQKSCSTVPDSILKECLVKNWNTITSDCQDALGKPFDGAGHGGER
jgi:hypothetical protein